MMYGIRFDSKLNCIPNGQPVFLTTLSNSQHSLVYEVSSYIFYVFVYKKVDYWALISLITAIIVSLYVSICDENIPCNLFSSPYSFWKVRYILSVSEDTPSNFIRNGCPAYSECSTAFIVVAYTQCFFVLWQIIHITTGSKTKTFLMVLESHLFNVFIHLELES